MIIMVHNKKRYVVEFLKISTASKDDIITLLILHNSYSNTAIKLD